LYVCHRLLLLESEAVRFKLTDAPYSPMNRDNVCLINVYRHAGSGRTVVAATAHLLFNPKRGDVKLNQLCMALARIADAAERHGNAPVVLAGDLNVVPGSALHRFAVDGVVDLATTDHRLASGQFYALSPGTSRAAETYSAETLRPLLVAPQVAPALKEGRVWVDGDALRHGLNLRSVYPHVSGRPPMITQWQHGGGFKGTVDYILYSPGYEKPSLALLMAPWAWTAPLFVRCDVTL
jgi:mRNA deadenylase 3'-5' endonuclease subunit Ccr4